MGDHGTAATTRVAVIGAGFGGIAAASALLRAGHRDVTVYERASDIGGVWRDNTYPGAACDVPSHLYSYAEQPGYDWSRRFASQPDILAYLRRCAHDAGVMDHVVLGVEITAARWDETAAHWVLSAADGARFHAEVLVTACGQLSTPRTPALPGLDTFTGAAFHSARWDHDHDMTGRAVAVVGTGASAVQFVPHLAAQAHTLTVFQRSAPWVIPRPDRVYSRLRRLVGRRVPASRVPPRFGFRAFFETAALGLTRHPVLSWPLRLAHRALLRRQVTDPALRATLRPDHPMGCKRVLISSDYYPALARPNVEVVTSEIVEVLPDRIRTDDGREHPCDTIVFGTGFAATEFLSSLRVTGRDDRELHDVWSAGAFAHLGITVPGFPNLFLLYGPNTNLGSGSIVHMLECQARYLVCAVRVLSRSHISALDVRADVAADFDAETQSRLADAVWSSCDSWYRDASGRISTNWPGLMREYTLRTRTLDVTEYRVTHTTASGHPIAEQTH